MKDVSVIIVNYNTCQLTKDCIDSIFRETKDIDFEVIVIDNNSCDSSQDELCKDQRIHFIESGENLGFGKANNLGFEVSHGKYVFFLYCDTILQNNAIKLLYDFLISNDLKLNIGAVGSLLLAPNGSRTHSFAPYPNMWTVLRKEWTDHFLKRFGVRSKQLEEGLLFDVGFGFFPVDYVTGADLFVSRDVLERYGAFDPDFFMYYEETEMQYRWHKYGLQSYVLCSPKIVHLEGGSQNKTSVRKQLMQLRSMLLYFKKTCSKWEYALFRIVFFIGRLFTLPLQNFNKEDRNDYLKILS